MIVVDKIGIANRFNKQAWGLRITGGDNRAPVTGQPLFDSDHVVPGMKYAVYQKCPETGGLVVKANLEENRTLPARCSD